MDSDVSKAMEPPKPTGSVADTSHTNNNDNVMIDCLKGRHRGVHTQQPIAIPNTNAQQNQVTEAVIEAPDQHGSPAAIETVRQPLAAQEGNPPEASPDIRLREDTGLWCHPCDTCRSLDLPCDCQYPVCVRCAASAPWSCAWTASSFPGLQQHQVDTHRWVNDDSSPDMALDGEDSFNLDFSTLDNTDVLENFDFDSFVNSGHAMGGSSLSCLLSDDDENDFTEYWRSTVAAADPVVDVERPRPRPRGV